MLFRSEKKFDFTSIGRINCIIFEAFSLSVFQQTYPSYYLKIATGRFIRYIRSKEINKIAPVHFNADAPIGHNKGRCGNATTLNRHQDCYGPLHKTVIGFLQTPTGEFSAETTSRSEFTMKKPSKVKSIKPPSTGIVRQVEPFTASSTQKSDFNEKKVSDCGFVLFLHLFISKEKVIEILT